MRTTTKLWMIYGLFFCTVGCKPSPEQQSVVEESTPLPADFLSFSEKFHTDSLFQMAHIIFPLDGQVGEPADRVEDFKWNSDEWLLHRPYDDMGGTYEQSYFMVNNVVVEKIFSTIGDFSMERRWAKLGDSWNLIYYKEMGP